MNLKQAIEAWDGKSADDIRNIYDCYGHTSSFVSEIIRLTKQEPLQKGTTWLLKRYLEKTGCLETSEVEDVCQLFSKLEHWEARLNILQCIPYMPIPKTQKMKVKTFLKECLVDDAKFVRAWAYNGYYELAVQYSEYQKETQKLLEIGMREEAASVKARIRNIRRKGF